ncbi:MAG TPA: HlyD family secretion protein [Pirellulales bacterium]|jgi:membrane fusion protein (multidrug efflux system)|nr:HlyD family secretion protein [Pirellulales bacterium]
MSNEPADPQKSEHGDEGKEKRRPSKPIYQRPFLMFGLIGGVVVVVIVGAAWWLYARQFESTDDAFIDGHTVQVAPKISGYVAKLLIDDNQLVNAGDTLLEIDSRDYDIALANAQAAAASALGAEAQGKARVDAAIAEAAADDAQVLAAQATAENAQQDYERNNRLTPRSVSQQTLDSSAATAKSSVAQTAAAKARADSAAEQIRLAKAQLASAQADVKQALVKVGQAKLNLSYTKIVSPIQGRVTHRTVELGDYIEPGQPLFALVDPNLWVTANFKETQLTQMRSGQSVEITFDAYPGRKLQAHIDSFQRGTGARFSALPPENATGNYVKVVQRVPVKIAFDQPIPDDMVLGPGMSVIPTVSIRKTGSSQMQSTTAQVDGPKATGQQ